MIKPSSRTLLSWLGAMPLAAILIPAGGLGLAPLAGLFVLFSAPAGVIWRAMRQAGPATILSALAVGWFSLSYVWSPYERPDEMIKLALLTPLFAAMPLAALQIEPRHLPVARAGFVFCAATVLAVMAVESLTSGDMTFSYKIAVEGYTGTRETIQGATDRVLSRGATAAMMVGGLAVLALWSAGRPALTAIAGVMAVITGLIAMDFNVFANAAAFAAAILVCALGLWRPRQILPALLCGMAAMILFAPVIFAGLLALMGEEIRALLPLSWEWRLEIWAYALQRMGEQPFFGHGLGASRVIETATTLHGMEIELLPLHAHNAGLTIWLETGFVGAALAAAALLAAARACTRLALSTPTVLMVCWTLVIWFVNATLSYGIWQEWHHAAVALCIAVAIIFRPVANPAGNLRPVP